jgi:hypothetical protein
MTNTSKLIAKQNDEFRSDFGEIIKMPSPIKGRYIVTCGIDCLSYDERFEIVQRIREFNSFTLENDPYGEHDFGRFQLEESKQDILWKIDYYDANYEFGSENPSNPQVTRRVLTAMLADEY